MTMLAVNAAHWWGPAGWLFRNTPGNLAASGIAFVAGVTVGSKALKGLHSKLDRNHAATTAIHTHLGITTQNEKTP